MSTEAGGKMKAVERESRKPAKPTRGRGRRQGLLRWPPVQAMIGFIDDHREADALVPLHGRIGEPGELSARQRLVVPVRQAIAGLGQLSAQRPGGEGSR